SAALPECVGAPLLAQEAMMGRATAEESLAGIPDQANMAETAGAEKSEQTREYAGSLERALDYYRELATKYPDSILGKRAEQRVKEMEASRSPIDQFYAEVSARAAPKTTMPAPAK